VITPVPVGLGRGSPIYRLSNMHLFSKRNLVGSDALLCWLSLVPRTDHTMWRAANRTSLWRKRLAGVERSISIVQGTTILPGAATAVPGHSGKDTPTTTLTTIAMVSLSMQAEHATQLTGAPCDCRCTAVRLTFVVVITRCRRASIVMRTLRSQGNRHGVV
jgi:hypothetical protein